ncbi:MAG: energy transducer TonB [Chitinophagaceae bacterium]|jgi:protein TonB|nr:energy transducer TonB [Chitinophagaceae bacterium]
MYKLLLVILFVCITPFIHAQTQEPTLDLDTIYTMVDVMPTYPNGDAGWQAYLKKNLKYPKFAKKSAVESEVVLELIVRKDGSLTNIKYLTIAGYGFEEEAVRLLKQCEKWSPAFKNGKPVNYKGRITIPFKLRLFKSDKD